MLVHIFIKKNFTTVTVLFSIIKNKKSLKSFAEYICFLLTVSLSFSHNLFSASFFSLKKIVIRVFIRKMAAGGGTKQMAELSTKADMITQSKKYPNKVIAVLFNPL
jgi:hypothetical protein